MDASRTLSRTRFHSRRSSLSGMWSAQILEAKSLHAGRFMEPKQKLLLSGLSTFCHSYNKGKRKCNLIFFKLYSDATMSRPYHHASHGSVAGAEAHQT